MLKLFRYAKMTASKVDRSCVVSNKAQKSDEQLAEGLT